MNNQADRIYPLVFLLLMLGIAGWLLYWMMRPFLDSIFVAFVIAVAFSPIHRRIRFRLRKDVLAAVISTILVLVLLLAPIVGLVVVFAHQGMGAYQQMSDRSAAGGGWNHWVEGLLDKPIQWISSKTGMPPPKVMEVLTGWVQTLSRRLIQWSGSLAGNLGSTISDTLVVFFTLFFFFLEGRSLQQGLIQWLPVERHRAEHLISVTFDTIKANLFGILAVSAAQGTLAAIAFLICGMGSWLFWGIVAAFASLLPIVGAAIIWVPIALQFLVLGYWGKALFLAIWGTLVIGMADNIIRPWIVSGRTSMSTLTVFFALLGGLQAFGLIGLIAGPLVFTMVITLYKILQEMRLGGDGVPVELKTESLDTPTS